MPEIPVELAKYYSDQGADEMVFLDITATSDARKYRGWTWSRTHGGTGVCPADRWRWNPHRWRIFSELLRAGADKISVNSAAVKDPALIARAAERFGSQCVVLAIDARSRGDGTWEVVIAGGRTPTGLDVVEWAEKGAGTGRRRNPPDLHGCRRYQDRL